VNSSKQQAKLADAVDVSVLCLPPLHSAFPCQHNLANSTWIEKCHQESAESCETRQLIPLTFSAEAAASSPTIHLLLVLFWLLSQDAA